MGNSYSSTQTVPQQVPLVAVDQRFALPTTTTLNLKNKLFSLSGEDSTVKDSNGNPFFKIKGKMMSMRQKKTLLDIEGNVVLNIKEPVISFPKRYDLSDAEGKKICSIKNKFTFFGTRMNCAFVDKADGKAVMLSAKGDFRAKNGIITMKTEDGEKIPVAKLYRKLSAGDIIFSAESYCIEIASGVDIALIVAFCVCLDDRRDDKQ